MKNSQQIFLAANGHITISLNDSSDNYWRALCDELENHLGFSRSGEEVVSCDEKIFQSFVKDNLEIESGWDIWSGKYLLSNSDEGDYILELAYARANNGYIPAAYAIIEKESKILIARRFNTGYEDGKYSLIAGHVENNETFTACIVRESYEEIGIKVKKADAKLFTSIFRNKNRLDVFFVIKNYHGQEKICEPHKCDDLIWIEEQIPDNTIPYIKEVLAQYIEYRKQNRNTNNGTKAFG